MTTIKKTVKSSRIGPPRSKKTKGTPAARAKGRVMARRGKRKAR